jgi:alpha-glucosidase (family GH31 glycosyl hydrolase)
MNATKGA